MMLCKSWLLGVASLSLGATADEGRGYVSGNAVSVTSEYVLHYRAIYPPGLGADFGQVVMGEQDAAGHALEHRIFVDTRRGLYYGYDIRVTKSDSPPGFHVALGPLSPEAERRLREQTWLGICPRCPSPRPVASREQRYPPAQFVSPGDKIVVDLLADERSGQTVSDEITVSSPSSAASPRESGPRDFRSEDVWLQLTEAHITVAGEPARRDVLGNVQGEVVWVQLPDHGRVFFSLVPRPGYPFKKVGVVTGSRLRFTIEGRSHEITSEAPIVTPGPIAPFNSVQSWNVWVLHDAAFERPPAPAIAAGGGLDVALREGPTRP